MSANRYAISVYNQHQGQQLGFFIMCMCILPGKAVPEMTYTVSGGTFNPTHSTQPFIPLGVCTGCGRKKVDP